MSTEELSSMSAERLSSTGTAAVVWQARGQAPLGRGRGSFLVAVSSSGRCLEMNGAPTEPTERYVSDVDGCEEGRGGVKVSGVRHNGDASVRLLPPSQIGDFQRRPWQPQGSGCRQHQPLSPVQVRVVAACLSWTRAHSLPPSIIETPTSPAPSRSLIIVLDITTLAVAFHGHLFIVPGRALRRRRQ